MLKSCPIVNYENVLGYPFFLCAASPQSTKMEGSASFKSPPPGQVVRISTLSELNDCLDRHKLKISKVSIRTGRIPSVRVTQGIVTNRKKKATKGLDHYLLYPDVDVADLARPSMRYRAGLRALGEIAEMNVFPTRSFENMLDQFDRKCDVMLDQKAQAGIDADQFTGSKRQLDLLEADFIKKEKLRRIELEVQAEVGVEQPGAAPGGG